MNDLIFALALSFGLSDCTLPDPTTEQSILVEKMGDDDFFIRQKANKSLKDQGIKAIKALKLHGLSHKDLEIKKRSQIIVDSFYNISNSNNSVPRIYGLCKLKEIKLPSNRKFVIQPNTAQKLFLMHCTDGKSHYVWDEYSDAAMFEATRTYSRNLLINGYSREDVIAILDAIEENETKNVKTDLLDDETKKSVPK